jgi:streptomycin 6-kinase
LPVNDPVEIAAHWGLSAVRQIADGIGGRIFEATGRSGLRVIVKQPSALAVSDGEPPRGADFLRWRDGSGIIRLLNQDGDLQLLEHAGDHLLKAVFDKLGDDAATEIACDVLEQLHAPSHRPAPPSLEPLPAHFAACSPRRRRTAKTASPASSSKQSPSPSACSQPPPDHRPLHGDIHHENIIEGPRGWLAIDPKGLIGDRAFDAANLFYNPLESPLRHSEARISQMATILSARTGIARAHLLDHAFAFSALSASWHVEDGSFHEAEASLAVGRAVRAVRSALSL